MGTSLGHSPLPLRQHRLHHPRRHFWFWTLLMGFILIGLGKIAVTYQYHVFKREQLVVQEAIVRAKRYAVPEKFIAQLRLQEVQMMTARWGPIPVWWLAPTDLLSIAQAAQKDILTLYRAQALRAGAHMASVEAPWTKVATSSLQRLVSRIQSPAKLHRLTDQWSTQATTWAKEIGQLTKIGGGLVDSRPKDIVDLIQQLKSLPSTASIAKTLYQAAHYLALPPAQEIADHTAILNTLLVAFPYPTESSFVDPLMQYLATRDSLVSVALYDRNDDTTYYLNPSLRFDTASIIKATIMSTLLWDSQKAHIPLTASEQQLMIPMIEYSNNNAATALWDLAGRSHGIQTFLNVAGLTQTIPGKEGYWGLTTTSALDQVKLLKLLSFPNNILTPASQAYAANLMTHVIGWEDWGVSGGIPSNVTVALKNGWLPDGRLTA
ncbi:MAG: hypothetical protein C7B46_20580 [Sulfobacillus benefaciens]|uniref:Beta-lactamase class A catalytic domain-containing protein n=1 Tax=Sulfobacillus benefaciens TaxID=453960 RepID=A0A2T2WTS9_9FIRM|nr:MAG: hypothetical protein C7B46_20580 [Sulfobacillus benefaciens]